MAAPIGDRSEIVFFDLEAREIEPRNYVIVEFGAILVDSRTLQEVEGGSYSTFVRPADPNHISSFHDHNGITKEALASAPTFAEIADRVYSILDGRIWAGHNIVECDCDLIRKAFEEIRKDAPEPKGTFDSVLLLRSRGFEREAGDNGMNTVAAYFGLGKQKHRSLEDVRMNIEVLKCYATVLLMPSSKLPKFHIPPLCISPPHEESEMAVPTGDRSEIVFFDLEKIQTEQGFVIVEFGAMLLDPKTLVLHRSFSTLVQPTDPIHISPFSNGITEEALASAPIFAQIADHIHDLLHGRIWAGYKIKGRDCNLIREAFEGIGKDAPQPKGTFDSVQLLRWQRFERAAGDNRMASVATFFGLGEQKYRSLEDVWMNIEVLKCCAAVLLMESTRPDLFPTLDFLKPDDIFTASISVTREPDRFGYPKMQIRHKDVPLKLSFAHLYIRIGINTEHQLPLMVDAPPRLCEILDTCDHHAHEEFCRSGASYEWRPIVIRTEDFNPRLRLRLQTRNGDFTHLDTEIYRKDRWGFYSKFDVMYDDHGLDSLFRRGNHVDACFSLDTYDIRGKHAGIRLVAEKLILHY